MGREHNTAMVTALLKTFTYTEDIYAAVSAEYMT
jgi:hypothetical protein